MKILISMFAILACLAQQSNADVKLEVNTYVKSEQIIEGDPVIFVLEIVNNGDRPQKVINGAHYTRFVTNGNIEPRKPHKWPDAKDVLIVDAECYSPGPQWAVAAREAPEVIEIAPGKTAFIKIELPAVHFQEGEGMFRVILRTSDDAEVAKSEMKKILIKPGNGENKKPPQE